MLYFVQTKNLARRSFVGQNCLCPQKKGYFQWVKSFRPKLSKFQSLKEYLKFIWQVRPSTFNRNTKECGCRVFCYWGRTSFGSQYISLNMWTLNSYRAEEWQFLFCICIVLSLSPWGCCHRMLYYKWLRNIYISSVIFLVILNSVKKMRLCTCVLGITTFLFINCEILTMIFVVSSVRSAFCLVSLMVWKWNNYWNIEGDMQCTAQQWRQRWSCDLHPTDGSSYHLL